MRALSFVKLARAAFELEGRRGNSDADTGRDPLALLTRHHETQRRGHGGVCRNARGLSEQRSLYR